MVLFCYHAVICKDTVTEGACYVIQGKVTMFEITARRQLEASDVYSSVSQAIKYAMNSGDLNSANPNIINLKYLNDGTQVIEAPSTNQVTKIVSGKSGGVPAYAYAMLGAVMALVAGYFGAKRYQSTRNTKLRMMMLGDDRSAAESTHISYDFSATVAPMNLPHSYVAEVDDGHGDIPAVVVTAWDRRFFSETVRL